MATAPSNFVPPEGPISIAAAAWWCAFHFRVSVSVAREYLLNAVRLGHLTAFRTDGTGEVPPDEAALWSSSPERFWNRELGDFQTGVELPLVEWQDARAVLATSFFEPCIAAPWPDRTPLAAWADIPSALKRLKQAPELRNLPKNYVEHLGLLGILLNYTPVGTEEAGVIVPVAFGLGETWRIQQGHADPQQDLVWVLRATKGDPNNQPSRYGLPARPVVSWLPIRRWQIGSDGPEELRLAEEIRAVVKPLVHVPTWIAAITQLLQHSEQLRHIGLIVPRSLGQAVSWTPVEVRHATMVDGQVVDASDTAAVGDEPIRQRRATKTVIRAALVDFKSRLKAAGDPQPNLKQRLKAIRDQLRPDGWIVDREEFSGVDKEFFSPVNGRRPKSDQTV